VKLAEALAERKALQDRLATMTNRARQSVMVAEGQKPHEAAQTLMQDMEEILAQWENLVTRINRTNVQTVLPNGKTIMESIAQRDRISRMLQILTGLSETIMGVSHDRYEMMARRDVAMVPAVDVPALQQRIDELSSKRVQLDLTIQEAGWSTDLSV
jgi:arginine decarboxylase-like protein